MISETFRPDHDRDLARRAGQRLPAFGNYGVAPLPGETVPEGDCDGVGQRRAQPLRQFDGQSMGLGVLDVEAHGGSLP